MDHQMIDGPAGLLHYEDHGEGDRGVLFLHSLAGNTTQWAAQLEHAGRQWRVLALDLRGHGRSAAPADGRYTLEAMSEDVAAVVEAAALKHALLVGHSLGAGVAMAYAANHASRVSGLLLADPIGDQRQVPADAAGRFIAALESEAYAVVIKDYWRHILQNASPEVTAHVLADLGRTPRAAVLAVYRALLEFDPVSVLARYSGPRRAVITPLNNTPFSLHKLVPDLSHVTMTGTSHWLQMDKPGEFNRILDDFVAVVPGWGA